jgi:hypothetical protein
LEAPEVSVVPFLSPSSAHFLDYSSTMNLLNPAAFDRPHRAPQSGSTWSGEGVHFLHEREHVFDPFKNRFPIPLGLLLFKFSLGLFLQIVQSSQSLVRRSVLARCFLPQLHSIFCYLLLHFPCNQLDIPFCDGEDIGIGYFQLNETVLNLTAQLTNLDFHNPKTIHYQPLNRRQRTKLIWSFQTITPYPIVTFCSHSFFSISLQLFFI